MKIRGRMEKPEKELLLSRVAAEYL